MCALFGDLLGFCAAELGPQLLCYITRYFLLQRDHINTLAAILLAPNFGVVTDTRKLSTDLDAVTLWHYAASDYGRDAQITADLLHVNLFSFVTED